MKRLFLSLFLAATLFSRAEAGLITYQADVTIANSSAWMYNGMFTGGPPSFDTGFSGGETYVLTMTYDDAAADSNASFSEGSFNALTQFSLTPSNPSDVNPGAGGWSFLDVTTNFPAVMFAAAPVAPGNLPAGTSITTVDFFHHKLTGGFNDAGTGLTLAQTLDEVLTNFTHGVQWNMTDGVNHIGVTTNVSNFQQITAVPEPSSMLLVGGVLGGAAVRRLRRRRLETVNAAV